MKNRKRILRGLCIAVLLLIVSALCSGCLFPFSIIGNWGYVRTPGVSIEVLNSNHDPVTYLSQPNNITCAATVACMIGNFYGFSWYTSDADILQVHDVMTNGNSNRRATYGEFVSYCQSEFMAFNWGTIGAGEEPG